MSTHGFYTGYKDNKFIHKPHLQKIIIETRTVNSQRFKRHAHSAAVSILSTLSGDMIVRIIFYALYCQKYVFKSDNFHLAQRGKLLLLTRTLQSHCNQCGFIVAQAHLLCQWPAMIYNLKKNIPETHFITSCQNCLTLT